jgi:hypothetical protein
MALLKTLCWVLIFIIRIRFPPGTSLVTIINNSPLNRVESFKYLGITLNQTLSWSDHTEALFTKVNQRLGIIRRVKHLLTVESRRTL